MESRAALPPTCTENYRETLGILRRDPQAGAMFDLAMDLLSASPERTPESVNFLTQAVPGAPTPAEVPS
jgi:hypothetical protein